MVVVFILFEHCDWVCKAVSGKGRGRTPLKDAKTLCKLRDVAQSRMVLGFNQPALTDDPLVSSDKTDADALTTLVKKGRSVQYALLEVNFQIEAAGVAPHGYRLSASVGCIEMVALKR